MSVFRFLLALTVVVPVIHSSNVAVAQRKRQTGQSQVAKNLPDLKTPEDKMRFLEMIRYSFPAMRTRGAAYTSKDLDQALETYVSRATKTPFSELIDDETFIRRVSLDATGQIPDRDAILNFVADKNSDKRSKLIDDL
ncbi:MAG: DUF1549 domain-containing protein, partial [Planctomycetaceae bacterium]|nr:DUF1549 domain-containing protein [Planctomycetaceae bacterium]